MHGWGSRTTLYLLGPLDPRVMLEGVQPNQRAIRDITYNLDIMNSPS